MSIYNLFRFGMHLSFILYGSVVVLPALRGIRSKDLFERFQSSKGTMTMENPMQGIRDLTGGQLAALVQKVGGPGNVLGILREEVEVTCTWIRRLLKCEKSFDVVSHVEKGWDIWRGPIHGAGLSGEIDHDSRSLRLVEINWAKVTFKHDLKDGERAITGEEKLRRQKEAGHIRFGGNVFVSLWLDYQINKASSVLECLYQMHGITFLDFLGLILRDAEGNRHVLCLLRSNDQWVWEFRWLNHRWVASYVSGVSDTEAL